MFTPSACSLKACFKYELLQTVLWLPTVGEMSKKVAVGAPWGNTDYQEHTVEALLNLGGFIYFLEPY